jgi:uncharacterized membrane protein
MQTLHCGPCALHVLLTCIASTSVFKYSVLHPHFRKMILMMMMIVIIIMLIIMVLVFKSMPLEMTSSKSAHRQLETAYQ